MTKELTTIEGVGITALAPTEVLDNARDASKALMGVMEQKKKKVIITGEQYLEYEDWQTLGQFYGVGVITRGAEFVEIDGVKGARAKADVVNLKTGLVIGGAEAYCLRDEENWQEKPWFQLASMAQTRAGAKALRNRLAWIAVLAGFKPTPAEEMEGVKPKGHWCPVHQVVFFKKGAMKGYAHKIEGTDEWCNEADFAPVLTETPQSKSSPVKEESNDNISEEPTFKNSGELMKWVYDQKKTIDWACKALNVVSPKEIKDIKEAHKILVEKLKGG